MTEMRAREVRLNLILAVVTSAIGLTVRLVGAAGIKKNLFLSEYAQTAHGVGGAILVIGLIWLGLALLKHALLPPAKPPR